ncbi:MAG: tetratricopeptide repeat protein, partial [Acidobacteria bacterium]|nr:tetratricopeptide repeat protein [Acidobacteriota bacterium]
QRGSLRAAVECFEQAIAADPNYAPPHAALASTYGTVALWGLWPLREVWPKAQAAAVRALELDDELAEAHAALGNVKGWFEYNWPEAERHFRRALELSPGNASLHWWYGGFYLCAVGRLPEALAEMRRAQELDPLSLPINTNVAWILFHLRRYTHAIEQCRRVLEWDPNYLEVHLTLGCAYILAGDFSAAAAVLERARTLAPEMVSVLGLLGWSYALAGRRGEAEQLLAELLELARQRPASMYIAWIYIGLGDNQHALDWFEKAYEERDPHVAYAKVVPPYDPLRSERRFIALLEKMGLG